MALLRMRGWCHEIDTVSSMLSRMPPYKETRIIGPCVPAGRAVSFPLSPMRASLSPLPTP
jgi:hypothetical protein